MELPPQAANAAPNPPALPSGAPNASTPAQPERRKRGFAAMDPEKRREIARRGGKASGGRPENLRGVDRSEAGRKGGRKVVEQYGAGHMAEIGRHGGDKVVQQYGAEHMAEIGRQGGQARGRSARGETKPEEAHGVEANATTATNASERLARTPADARSSTPTRGESSRSDEMTPSEA